ncbi:MAG TPA: T9SS type A sorting domain-containing protein [Paludibacter sp.]|nr:T9SS type A sorting domain-containing protein [Paludibacter sp.]
MRKIYIIFLIVLTTSNCFAQWSQTNNGIANLSLGATLLGYSDSHLFSGAAGKMYKTNDNGNNWSEIQPPVTGNIPECGYNFSNKYFAGLNASTDCIFYSEDNGTSWKSVSGGPTTTVVRGFIGLSENIFAYTSSKGVYKSTDGGLNWSAANAGLTNLNVIYMTTLNSKIYAGTIGGGVFISTDTGVNWTQSNSGIASSDLNTTFIWQLGTKLYYVDQGGGSYVSVNDGNSWTSWVKPAMYGLSPVEISRHKGNLYVKSRHYAAGLKDSVYMTGNEGVNWKNITDNLPLNLNWSRITEFNGNVFVAFNMMSPNLGIYRKSLTTSISYNTKPELIKIYPNPFVDKITFNNTGNQRIIKISIRDIQGKTILTESNLNENFLYSGDIKNGVYFAEIMLENKQKIHQKLIKVSEY